jgi:acyl-CoA thioester hydrolase
MSERLMLIQRKIEVQTYDIDAANHVNNQVYLRWLEDMRMDFLRTHCPLEELLDKGQLPILHSTYIEYKRPVNLFDTPVGSMWCVELGRATFKLDAEIHVGDTLCTTARQRGILLHTPTNRPARWPKVLYDKYCQLVHG